MMAPGRGGFVKPKSRVHHGAVGQARRVARCYVRDPDGYVIEVGQSKPEFKYG
jgi:catechol 2,3-dioxygenase-like lactoylglutathione lyase family enzyme